LPEGFAPDASTGLGLKIIRSFARQIGGELQIGRGAEARAQGLQCCSLEWLRIRPPMRQGFWQGNDEGKENA
jgi:hypothetical protein